MLSINKLKLVIIFSIIIPTLAFSLPMEWHGVFAVDHHSLQNYRGVEENNTPTDSLWGETQEPLPAPGNQKNATFQSYIIKLRPTLTINDSASFFAELTTGYGRGGFFGEKPVQNYPQTFGNALYHINMANFDNPINLNQFYMELYSDTAIYQIGRSPDHFGMGLVLNDGHNTWDRFASTRDQLKINFKIGNFSINPFVGKIGTGGSLTTATHAYEYGIPVFYEVAETDLTFGVIWINRSLAEGFDGYRFNLDKPIDDASPTSWKTVGKSNVNFIDIYLKKIWGKFKLEIEIPFFTGEMGNLYKPGEMAKYRAMAGVVNLAYTINDYWKVGLDGGFVSGDDGSEDAFNAMFLNPNYNIAFILFHYNASAISSVKNPGYPFDAYITDTTFFRLYGEFVTGRWNMNLTAIYAFANNPAKAADPQSYNPQKNKLFNAKYDQDKGLGFELDYGLTYSWNDEINIGLDLAYLMAGDYWAFNNTDTPNTLRAPWLFKFKASMDF
ncbi:MAG: hypothetical protein E2O68_04690 [Deltaproteobacteria bacterium]|nr:MAG: hypothetical protein E2O68_04690 [Deltaproteobacteria bacterium]